TKPSWLKVLNKTVYLNMADLVLTNSKSLQNEMHGVYKVAKQKTRRVPFWTNISKYRSESNTLNIIKGPSVINIGCPGRLVADKNHSMVIEALHQLKQTTSQAVRLYLAGSGPYKNPLEQ